MPPGKDVDGLPRLAAANDELEVAQIDKEPERRAGNEDRILAGQRVAYGCVPNAVQNSAMAPTI